MKKHFSAVSLALAFLLLSSSPSIFIPRYCAFHQKVDFCWVSPIKPHGGGGEEDL